MIAYNGGTCIQTAKVVCPLCDAVAYDHIAAAPDFDYRACLGEFHMVRCRRCRVLYLNPRPIPSELWRIYPVEYGAYHFDESAMTFRLRDYLERRKARLLLGLFPGEADILDVGCGGAGFMEKLRKFGGGEW